MDIWEALCQPRLAPGKRWTSSSELTVLLRWSARYPLRYEPRTPFQFTKTAWSGLLTNGSVVAPGTYKIRMSALKVFGNPKRMSDWEIALSDYITIVGA